MGESSSLPPWLNMIWMSISFITLIGAGIWTFVFFYPYLKQVRAMQFEALKLGRESTKVLEELHGQIKPLVDKIDRNVGRVDELFGKLEEFAGGRAVDRDRLLHEDVQPLFDCVGVMHPAEPRWCRQNHNVSGAEAVHDLFVGIKADEAVVDRNIDFRTNVFVSRE